MVTRMVAAMSVSLLLLCAACGGNGATPADADGAGAGQIGDVITGVQDVACSTHAVWPVPACVPSCSAGKFHVELSADDQYPGDRVLFLSDGRTLVAQSAPPDGETGQVRLVLLSDEGAEEASATIEPCEDAVPVDLPDLEAGDNGELLLLAACSPWSDEQRILLVRIDSQLDITKTQEVLVGAEVNAYSLSLATLEGVLHLLAVVVEGNGNEKVSKAVLVTNPSSEHAVETELVQAAALSVGPLLAEEGRLVVTLVEVLSDDNSEEYSAILVLDPAGVVLTELEGRRYAAGDLDYRPVAAHISGGDLVLAGQSWDTVIGADGWSSREAVIERRKLDGTLIRQTRIAMGWQTDFRALLPVPPSSTESAAAWLVVLADRHYTKSPDGGAELDLLPRFTWLTPELEARFGTLAPEGIPEMPVVLAPACDCGYRIAWAAEDSLHVARTNNLFRHAPEASCDDGLACTSESRSEGTCPLSVTTGCFGPDGCYEAGSPRSDNPCLLCGQKAECGALWQPLVDKAACGFDGKCEDGRCRCNGRWQAAKGSSSEMHKVLAIGLQSDEQTLAWTWATQVQSYPDGKLHGLLVSSQGEAKDLGPLAESWVESSPLLVADDGTYAAVGGKLTQMDRKGATVWSAPLPTWQPLFAKATYGVVQTVEGNVLAFYVGREDQLLLAGAALYSEQGESLGAGSWQESFEELEGEVNMIPQWPQPEDGGLLALALPGGRVLVLAGAEQVPSGAGIGLHHEFMVVVDKNGKDATLKVLPETHFAAAMVFKEDGFLACRDLKIEEWDLAGNKGESHDLSGEVSGGKDVSRSCQGLVPGPEGGMRMLVRVRDKVSKAEYGEVLVVGPTWTLLQTTPVPLVPSWNGISALPDGGFLVTGSLDSGVAAVLRADADGHYRCW